jgi:hypothetical protein
MVVLDEAQERAEESQVEREKCWLVERTESRDERREMSL